MSNPLPDVRQTLIREISYYLAQEGAAAADWLATGRVGDLADQLIDTLGTAGLIATSPAERGNVAAVRERDELRALFDMQWKRSLEAIALWRSESPTERALVMPDLGDLLAWLMVRIAEGPARGRAAVAADLRDHDAVLSWWLRPGAATEEMALDWTVVDHLADYVDGGPVSH